MWKTILMSNRKNNHFGCKHKLPLQNKIQSKNFIVIYTIKARGKTTYCNFTMYIVQNNSTKLDLRGNQHHSGETD